jgi:hypothetical protein
MPLISYLQHEIDLIIDYYPDVKTLVEFLPHRSIAAIRVKARALGLTRQRQPKWTLSEDAIIHRHHPDFNEIQRQIPHRTMPAIRRRCANLGLKKPYRKWTPAMDNIVLNMTDKVPDQQIADLLGVTRRALEGRRHVLPRTIRKRRQYPPKVPVVGDIVEEAKRRGLRLGKLTSALGYSEVRPSTSQQKLSMKAVAKVTTALGGVLYVEWDD